MRSKALPEGEHVLDTADGYDRWAAVYDSDGNPLTHLEEPEVGRLLGDVEGKSLLDVGCGTGRHAIALAQRGAKVTALDFSDGMLAQARAKDAADAVTFVQHDLAQRLPFEDASFERVLSCLVLEHIADLHLLFSEMGRVCSPGGSIVVTAMHPAMMLLGVQAGFRDPTTGDKMHPRSLRHQVSDFVNAAIGAGLRVDAMGEHAVDAALAANLPRAAKYEGWLMLLTLRFTPAP